MSASSLCTSRELAELRSLGPAEHLLSLASELSAFKMAVCARARGARL